jgi:hypothetical protein
MNAAGATVKLVIIDGARRNPFERRFRGLSTGLAPLTAPAGTLAIYSAAPDRAVNDSHGAISVFVTELLKQMRRPGLIWRSHTSATPSGYWCSGQVACAVWAHTSSRQDALRRFSLRASRWPSSGTDGTSFTLGFCHVQAIFNSTQKSVSAHPRASRFLGCHPRWWTISSSGKEQRCGGPAASVLQAAPAAPPPAPSTVASQLPSDRHPRLPRPIHRQRRLRQRPRPIHRLLRHRRLPRRRPPRCPHPRRMPRTIRLFPS